MVEWSTMNWYEQAKLEASSTNYSNLLNSAFENGDGTLDADDAVEEIENPDGGKKKKQNKNVCYYCTRSRK